MENEIESLRNKPMTSKEIVSMILAYESEIMDFYDRNSPRYMVHEEVRKEKTDKLIKKQVELIKNFKKDVLTDFLDFLLKNGYCDTDVYCEPPTAIDQYLIFNKKEIMKEEIYLSIKITDIYSGMGEAVWYSYDVFIKSKYGELLLREFDNENDAKKFTKKIKITLK